MIKVFKCMYVLVVCTMLAAFSTGCDRHEEIGSDGGSGVVKLTPKQQDEEKRRGLKETYQPVGGKGILWKPVSEGNRKLVVLLGGNYGAPGVSVLDTDLNVIEVGNYVGRTNGNRATYRFGRTGGSFPSPCLLQVGGGMYLVESPYRRHE